MKNILTQGQLDFMIEKLQEERYQSEQLRNQLSDHYSQWNDFTELHQNEACFLLVPDEIRKDP